jgi:hypothetical protein
MEGIMHRYSLAIPSALLLLTLAAGAVVAGGWAEVTVTEPPAESTAGEATTIGLRVMQHGETAVSWPRLTVIATEAASGRTIRAEAAAQGAVGDYVASVRFPADGAWTLTFESPDLVMSGTTTLRIGPAPAGASVTQGAPSSTASNAGAGSPLDGAAWLGLAALLAVALGLIVALLVVRLRGRRPTVVPG